MTPVLELTCIGEPISWLRLETFAAGTPDKAIDEHLRSCPACRHCLDALRADTVALPALELPAMPAPSAPRRRRSWLPVVGVALAAAVIALVVVPRLQTSAPVPVDPEPAITDTATVKGVGEVVLGTVRERDGAIVDDATTFAHGDRWKLVLTCAPGPSVRAETTVTEVDTTAFDQPLAAVQVVCGNRVVLPGAFELTGARANRVCVKLDGSATACVTIAPE